MKRYCSQCGKKQSDDPKPFINIFKDGNTNNTKSYNMMTACVNCARAYKLDRMNKAVKMLNTMGLRFNGKQWTYDGHKITAELVNLEALEHQIRFLKKENRELKELLNN